MSNERHPDTVEFQVTDRATCYIVTSANMQVEKETVELPGLLTTITLYAEGEWVGEYDPDLTLVSPEDLAFIQQAAETAGIKLDA